MCLKSNDTDAKIESLSIETLNYEDRKHKYSKLQRNQKWFL